MSRYIDADSFIDYLGLEDTEEAREENYGEIVTLSDFDNQPTADVEEVKHGQWVDLGDFEMCSECTGTHLKEFDTTYGKAKWAKSKYCPTCGAKMDL